MCIEYTHTKVKAGAEISVSKVQHVKYLLEHKEVTQNSVCAALTCLLQQGVIIIVVVVNL